jgi:hypothetical protein
MVLYLIKYTIDFYSNKIYNDRWQEELKVFSKTMKEAIQKCENYVKKENHNFQPYKEMDEETNENIPYHIKNFQAISCEIIDTADVV